MQERLDCLLREILSGPIVADRFISEFRNLFDPLFTVRENTAKSMHRGDTAYIPMRAKHSDQVYFVTRSRDPLVRLITEIHEEFESFLSGIAFGPSGDDEDSFPDRFTAFMDSSQIFPRYLLTFFEAVEKTEAHHATLLPDSTEVDRFIKTSTEELAEEIADAHRRLSGIRGTYAPVILRNEMARMMRKTAISQMLNDLSIRLNRAIGGLAPESHDGHFGGVDEIRSHRHYLSGLKRIRRSLLPRLITRAKSIAPEESAKENNPSVLAETCCPCD